jgi:tetratricopeptide (TPR) repeat protein
VLPKPGLLSCTLNSRRAQTRRVPQASARMTLKSLKFAEKIVAKTFVLSLLMGWGALAIAPVPTLAQAVLPYVPQQQEKDFKREADRLYKSAISLAQFQLYDQAIPRALLASQLDPARADILLLLGTLYLQDQKTDQSIAALQKAQSLNGKDADILLTLGTALFQKGDYNGAIQKLQAGLQIKPTSVSGLFDLGNAFYRSNRYPEAIATYRKAVQQKADFWPALNNIGLIQYENGSLTEATQSWRQSIAIDKKAAEPQLALAVALYKQGQQEEAYKLGEAALRNDSRYASMDYLKENLWGEKLLADTSNFLKTPRIRAALTLGSGNP